MNCHDIGTLLLPSEGGQELYFLNTLCNKHIFSAEPSEWPNAPGRGDRLLRWSAAPAAAVELERASDLRCCAAPGGPPTSLVRVVDSLIWPHGVPIESRHPELGDHR